MLAQEDEVEPEPHPERVDAAAAGDQESLAGHVPTQQRQAEQPGATRGRDRDAMSCDLGAREATKAAGTVVPRVSHAAYNPASLKRAPSASAGTGGMQTVVQPSAQTPAGVDHGERLDRPGGRGRGSDRGRHQSWRRQLAEGTTTRARTTSSSTASSGSRSTRTTSHSGSSRRR